MIPVVKTGYRANVVIRVSDCVASSARAIDDVCGNDRGVRAGVLSVSPACCTINKYLSTFLRSSSKRGGGLYFLSNYPFQIGI